ncbi:putative Cyclin-related protein FAM58A [Hypsibius exemplaris]|uniref:Cyclin-related protein FAM58A n=1 Tax=Hypsibius exemplaris TaxID=2072580 RepID=A0A1W0X559_HYPEX|nr:putative Cyclin-related protein FAM58A [Hypsibius exemplaris]
MATHIRQVVLFIQECGFTLELRELTVATACMLFHKYKHSPNRTLPLLIGQKDNILDGSLHLPVSAGTENLTEDYLVATSCLLLAGKTEENHLNIRKLINVAYKTFFKEKELADIDEYYSMRTSILTLELWLLRIVGFHPVCNHPHQYLVCFLKACQDWLPRDEFKRHPVAAVAWSLLRDAYLSELVIQEKPEHIALTIVACALQLLKITFPTENGSHRPWTKAFCHDLSSEHLDRLTIQLTRAYQ